MIKQTTFVILFIPLSFCILTVGVIQLNKTVKNKNNIEEEANIFKDLLKKESNKKGEIVFKGFKNKHYWILMPPFLLTSLLLIVFLPSDYKYYSFLVIILFWIVYYSWNYYGVKKNNHKNLE